MTDTEIMLLVYSLAVTCFAISYYSKMKLVLRGSAVLLEGIRQVAEGNAKIEKINGGIKLTTLENHYGNTSNQAGQSEGTDRS